MNALRSRPSMAGRLQAASRKLRVRVAGLVGAFLMLLLAQPPAHALDMYGYIDEAGVAHFATEALDARYVLFFRGEGSFDSETGKLRPGAAAPDAVAMSGARTRLLTLFEKSPDYAGTRKALRAAAGRHAIDYELLQALVAAESGFDASAVSPKGAIGLMQVMPATAARYGVQANRRGSIESQLLDPVTNIGAGARYLRDLIAMFEGQLELALAAYNAGEGAVQRAGNKIPNYRETQNYVKTVLQLYAYLKPGTLPLRGDKPNGRVRMELSAAPQGGAIGRRNAPPTND